MIYREMAGERVSRLGLGGMRLPVRGLLRSIDRAEADAMRAAAERDIAQRREAFRRQCEELIRSQEKLRRLMESE